jgi:UDP-glucose 4-epimerase
LPIAAHVAALTSFDDVLGDACSVAINLGTGTGTTVRELLTAFNNVESPVAAVEAPRRPGDQAGAYTRSDKAKKLLNWQSTYTVAEGIADSLRWAAIRDQVLTRR